MADDCIFCRVRDGEVPSEIVYRGDECFVIRDIAPRAPVHLLVIPVQHFSQLTKLTAAQHSMVGAMYEAAAKMARDEGVAESGYRLVVNQGPDSGQQVDHLHLHVLGGKPLGGMG